jgi:hypothetical protein
LGALIFSGGIPDSLATKITKAAIHLNREVDPEAREADEFNWLTRDGVSLEWRLVKGYYRQCWLDRPFRACVIYRMIPRALP